MIVDYGDPRVVSSTLGVSYGVAEDVLLFEELFFSRQEKRLSIDREYSLGNQAHTEECWSWISVYFVALQEQKQKTEIRDRRRRFLKNFLEGMLGLP